MKVRMAQQVSGSRDGQAWPTPGEEVDLSDAEGRAALRDGTAVEVDADHDSILVPTTGIHTPGTTAYEEPGVVHLVSVPVDAVSNPEGVKAALRAVADGDTVQVPAGTGLQKPTGAALTADEVKESVKADETAREDFNQPQPKSRASTTRTEPTRAETNKPDVKSKS
jgi:hypothetical protein